MNSKVTTEQIQSFESLRVWQSSRELNKTAYTLTRKFPINEQHGLTSQIRRASISVSSNIAEGYGRVQRKDKEHFYVIALGSITELLSQFIVSGDLGYITPGELGAVRKQINVTKAQLLALLIKHRS